MKSIRFLFVLLITGWVSVSFITPHSAFRTAAPAYDSLQYYIDRFEAIPVEEDSTQARIERWQRRVADEKQTLEIKQTALNKLLTEQTEILSRKKNTFKKGKTKKSELARLDTTINSTRESIAQSNRVLAECNRQLDAQKEILQNRQQEYGEVRFKMSYHVTHHTGSHSVRYHGMKFLVFTANTDSHDVRLHLMHSGTNFKSISALKKYLEQSKVKPLMITNAGMFTEDYTPQGLYVEGKGGNYYEIDTGKARPNANFYLKPNGVFYIDATGKAHIDTTEYVARIPKKERKKFRLATQSGPMLLINGAVHPAFREESKNLKIRNGVGLVPGSEKSIVFALAVDETNFYQFATLFRDVFGCNNALFLDGNISAMYLADIHASVDGGPFGPMISVSKKKK